MMLRKAGDIDIKCAFTLESIEEMLKVVSEYVVMLARAAEGGPRTAEDRT